MLVLDSTRPKVENPMWAWPGITPNERYTSDENYRFALDNWAKIWKKPGPHKFQQVRIIRTKTTIGSTYDWWNSGPWEECIFWVFVKPIYVQPSGKEHYGYYCLEYAESQRVIGYARSRKGYNPFPNDDEMLVIPVELCHHAARHETSGGQSDHLRPRELIETTPEEADKEAEIQEYVEEGLKQVEDLTQDPKWKKAMDAALPKELAEKM